jgi:hypothetical protein
MMPSEHANDELTDIRQREPTAHSPGVDLETLLDKSIDLVAHHPADTSAVHFDESWHVERRQQACREP